MSILDDYLSSLTQSSLFQKWKRDNPGESARFDAYIQNPVGPIPSMTTQAGRAFIRGLHATAVVAGGNKSFYLITSADEGKMIRCCVTARGPGGDQTACSNEIGPVKR